MAVAISIENVSKAFGSVKALDSVSLDIKAGEFFTLLGSSGCGKSTLLKMIGGFDRPGSGTIRFDGEDVGPLGPNRRPVNTVFQDLALFPHMTVAQNVGYGLKMRRMAPEQIRRRVEETLELVSLHDYGDRDIATLSGGQRQRVALARALIMEPGILLLDEPLTGLDERLRQQLRDEFGHLHKRTGATFVLVTHNQDEALSLSDRMAIMDRGRTVQVGPVEEFFQKPANAFVARFLGLEPLLRPERIEGSTAIIAGQPIAIVRNGQHQASPQGLIALRPDRIAILAPNETTDNTLSGTLSSIQFRGFFCDLSIRLNDGQIITTQIAPDRREDFAEGQNVRLALPLDAAILVSDAAH